MCSIQGVADYFAHLPAVDNPEIFGMHENANVTFNTNESLGLMQTASAQNHLQRGRAQDRPRSEQRGIGEAAVGYRRTFSFVKPVVL